MIYAMVLIPFLLFVYILIVPLGTSVYYSLTKWKGIGAPQFIGLQNFQKLFQDKNFWLVVKNTLTYSLYCTIGQVGLALIVSLLINGRSLKLKKLHRAVIFFPVIMAPVVVGFVWKMVYNADYGLLNTFLRAVGAENSIQLWLDNPKLVLTTASIPVIWQYVGLYMVMLLSSMSAIDESIYECASLDGANGFQQAIHITMPLIWNTFKIVTILVASGTIKIYDHIVALTNGGPGYYSMSMAMYAYKNTFTFFKYGYGSAISVMILVVAGIIGVGVQLLMGRKKA